MIIIREFFVARPGQAGKLAAMLKDVTDHGRARQIAGDDGCDGPVQPGHHGNRSG